MISLDKMGIVIRSQIRPLIKELDKENAISSVADEVGTALDKKVEDILVAAIERAKANKRRTIQARDL
jgi:histone H3/H4